MKIKILGSALAVAIVIPNLALATDLPRLPCAEISANTNEMLNTGAQRELVMCTQVKGAKDTNAASTATPISAANTINEPNGPNKYSSYVKATSADIANGTYSWRYVPVSSLSSSSAGVGGFDPVTGKVWSGSAVCKTVNISYLKGATKKFVYKYIHFRTYHPGSHWQRVISPIPYTLYINTAVTACAKISGSQLMTRITRTAITGGVYRAAVQSGWRGGLSSLLTSITGLRYGYFPITGLQVSASFDPNNPLHVQVNGTWYNIPVL